MTKDIRKCDKFTLLQLISYLGLSQLMVTVFTHAIVADLTVTSLPQNSS
jgi:hypothetical protein